MRKDELISSFYEDYGYIPSEEELNDYGNSNDDNYHSQPSFSRVRHSQSQFEFEPTGDLIIELNETIRFIATMAKKNLKNKQNDLICDDNINEWSYMLFSFLLKSALYFVLRKSYERGYKSIEIN